jgi:hypothetical protein
MQYNTDQRRFDGAVNQIVQNAKGRLADIAYFRDDRPLIYLRFWGDDYPYLNNNTNVTKGCLPIAEKSDAGIK